MKHIANFKRSYSSEARTLPVDSLGDNSSGWFINGEIQEDYYSWVNAFEAEHPDFGWVRGDYEGFVEAKSKKAFEHFFANHPPEIWDYYDI